MKELKISELADIWGCSVPTVWSRIKRKHLTTVLKKDSTGKEVNYVSISDEIINEFVNNGYNEVNNVNNNDYNEDLLSVENVNNGYNKNEKSAINDNTLEFVFNKLNEVNNDYNERLLAVNNDYNNRLERYNEELITYKSKQLLLEDKASREGLYLNEIKDLKASKNNLLKWLISVIVVLSLLLITVSGLLIFNLYNPINNDSQVQVQEIVKEKASK